MRATWLLLLLVGAAAGGWLNFAAVGDPDGDGDTTVPDATTTAAAAADTTTTTLKPEDTTEAVTTPEPEPQVEQFSVTCTKDEKPMCTYTMQVPGLDIDTFNTLIQKTNETETNVLKYQDEDMVALEDGVNQVYDEATNSTSYIQKQLEIITAEIGDLDVQIVDLESALADVTTVVEQANASLAKIYNVKSSCLYKQCVLKETTTPKPTTTPKTTTTPYSFCLNNENVCQNGGKCGDRYGSYECTCSGNLAGSFGDNTNCTTSVCDYFSEPQLVGVGLIYSPGYDGTAEFVEECDGAQWTVQAADPKNSYLELVDKTFDNQVKNLGSATLQLTVGKYKLKITSKTKPAQINQILNYGGSATFAYSGATKDNYFFFTISEVKITTTAGPTTTGPTQPTISGAAGPTGGATDPTAPTDPAGGPTGGDTDPTSAVPSSSPSDVPPDTSTDPKTATTDTNPAGEEEK